MAASRNPQIFIDLVDAYHSLAIVKDRRRLWPFPPHENGVGQEEVDKVQADFDAVGARFREWFDNLDEERQTYWVTRWRKKR